MDSIAEDIVDYFRCRQVRLTPLALEQVLLSNNPGRTKKEIRSEIKRLIAEGTLRYTNPFNTAHLELNFNKPFKVSERIWLSPFKSNNCPPKGEGITLFLHAGEAFGTGDHPTTRLCLRGVDWTMREAVPAEKGSAFEAMDIGTGSGVLAMAAVALGADAALAIDIDPVALFEAEKNINQNDLSAKITLSSDPIDGHSAKRYALVMANLRPPTLKTLLPSIISVSQAKAYWILSGFRHETLPALRAMLPAEKTAVLWTESCCDWSALVVSWKSPA